MKITKTRLREIIKEELEHAISEQRPPMPPPPPRGKTKDAAIEQSKTYNRFAKILEKVVVRGLGDLGSDKNEVIRAMKFFLGRASGKRVSGRGERGITKFLDSMSEREATDLLRKTYALAAKNMKKYTEARKAKKAELEKTRAQPAGKGGVKSRKLSPDELEASEKASQQMRDIKEGPLRAWCIGYEKDGKTKHQTVHADAAGFAERKIKREHDVRDKAIKSTKEGKCKGHA